MPVPARAQESYELNLRLSGFDAWLPKFWPGIYRIRNLVTDQCYIGATLNMRSRRSSHRHLLTYRAHNVALQSAFNAYGPESFVFEVILFCAPEWLGIYEQALISRWRPAYNNLRASTY